MKFRNPETGEIFENIGDVIDTVCQQKESCGYWCSLRVYKPIPGCRDFANMHPREAARLMGYEVIDEMREEMREPQLNAGRANSQQAKADQGKPHPSWVPVSLIEGVMAVREYGNRKYHDPDNWKQVEPERYWQALLRHTLEIWEDPYAVDQESGLLHLEHLCCNAAFLLQMRKEAHNE